MKNTESGGVKLDADLDHTFHRVISEASHNPVLVHTLQSLSQLTLKSVLASVNNLYHRREEKEKIVQHHRQIYRAIIDGDPEQAKVAACWHIREIKSSLQDIEREEDQLIRAEMWTKQLDQPKQGLRKPHHDGQHPTLPSSRKLSYLWHAETNDVR